MTMQSKIIGSDASSMSPEEFKAAQLEYEIMLKEHITRWTNQRNEYLQAAYKVEEKLVEFKGLLEETQRERIKAANAKNKEIRQAFKAIPKDFVETGREVGLTMAETVKAYAKIKEGSKSVV